MTFLHYDLRTQTTLYPARKD